MVAITAKRRLRRLENSINNIMKHVWCSRGVDSTQKMKSDKAITDLRLISYTF